MKKLKDLMSIVKNWPLHPQWLIYRLDLEKEKEIIGGCRDLVLDVGCAESTLRARIENNDASYIGLDYYFTATQWYKCLPGVYGDAHELPIESCSVETVLLLDVLEHLEDPRKSLNEAYRVLKPQGKVILSVPFLYPLHDAPRDFHRWTTFGLKSLLEQANFKVLSIKSNGNTLVTACLMLSIGLAEWCLERIYSSKLYVIHTLWVAPVILCSNLLGWGFSFFDMGINRGPFGLSVVATKEVESE